MNCRLQPRQREWLVVAIVLLSAMVLFFGRSLLLGQVYDAGDITRIYVPQRAELADALFRGELPWWSVRLGIGYPLVAEGETGALYPLNWLIYTLFSPSVGLTIAIILHYGWTCLGTYMLARRLGMSLAAGLFSAVTLAFGGFYIAHLTHISMLTVASWLPWMLACSVDVLAGHRALRSSLWLSLCVGMQFLSGHPQVSLLSLLFVGAFGVWQFLSVDKQVRSIAGLGKWAVALAGGVLLGLPQLLPSLELARYSQRAGGLEPGFFTSYSFHPLMIGTFLSPFALGKPHPEGSVELIGYMGLLPLALAAYGFRRRGSRIRLGLGLMAGMGLVLAFGRWNPLYSLLLKIPILNLFRVPARYLFWTCVAIALMAGLGLDALLRDQRSGPETTGRIVVSGAILIAASGAIAVRLTTSLDAAVALWRWLPLALAFSVGAFVWGARRVSKQFVAVAALVLVCADLFAFGAVLDRSFHLTASQGVVEQIPRAAQFLAEDSSLYRVYVKEEILPAHSVTRASLYPNVAQQHGIASANIYQPLLPEAYRRYTDMLGAAKLDRLNIKYYLIPQLLPVDSERELYDVLDPFAAFPTGEWLEIASGAVESVEVDSFLSHAVDMRDGDLAGEILLRTTAGQVHVLPIRAGIESAEWAYEREDVAASIQHAMPEIAYSWPSWSGYKPWEHQGHAYRAVLPISDDVEAVMIRPSIAEAFFRVESLCLVDSEGSSRDIGSELGLGSHRIVYRSEDVVIYENLDVLPRAYLVDLARVDIGSGGALLPDDLTRHDVGAVTITRYVSREIEIQAQAQSPALLVLADLAYPGWSATDNGIQVQIETVDGVMRGVVLGEGAHDVRFSYAPFHWLQP